MACPDNIYSKHIKLYCRRTCCRCTNTRLMVFNHATDEYNTCQNYPCSHEYCDACWTMRFARQYWYCWACESSNLITDALCRKCSYARDGACRLPLDPVVSMEMMADTWGHLSPGQVKRWRELGALATRRLMTRTMGNDETDEVSYQHPHHAFWTTLAIALERGAAVLGYFV